MIKAAIFDLGSVLVTYEWPLVYAKIAEEINSNPEKIKETIHPLFSKWCANEINEGKFWQEFEKQIGKRLSDDFTKDFWARGYKEWSKEIKGTWEIAKALKKRGIRLALLSNTTDLHVLINEEIGIFQKLRDIGFESFIYSYEAGCKKPCSQIYELVFKRLNLSAEDCVFVDDKLKNIEGAERLGMKGILFQGPQQLRKALIKLGLL
jgi:putative hydrolase of the HAD superfamily